MVGDEHRSPDLSLVIPCYNEAPHLEESVRQVREILDVTVYRYELIFIDDGSSDGTQEVIRRLCEGRDDTRAVFHSRNVGRGGTVAEGLRLARGLVAGFLDIDLEVHCRYLPALVQAVHSGQCDIATGRRFYKVNLTPSGLLRFTASTTYRLLARWVLGSPFADTETGCKFFRRERILPLLDKCRDTHWFWDTEIMLAAAEARLKVAEIPVLFVRNRIVKSSLRLVPDTIAYLKAIYKFVQRKRRDRAQGVG